MPRRTNTGTSFALSAMTTRSQARARCMPAPAAVPLTAAITGFSQSRTAVTTRCQPVAMLRATSPCARLGAPSGFSGVGTGTRRSAPVQNARSPAPVSTTARTCRSALASASASTSASRVFQSSALCTSCRSSVSVSTPLSRATASPSPTEHLPQLVLQHLVERLVARQLVDDLQPLGDLLPHQPRGGAGVDHLVEGQHVATLARRLHDCAHQLAPLGVGEPDDGDVADLRVVEQHVLELTRGDVLALADDDVLQPPGEPEMAVRPQHADVAGAEPALVVVRLLRRLLVGVAAAHDRAAHADLALLVRAGDGAVLGDDPHLGPEHRLALGVGELLVGVVRRAHRDHRDLGHAVAVHELDAHLALDVIEELRRLRRTATGHDAQRRDDLLPRRLALLA